MGILVNDFPDKDSAFAYIESEINEYYASSYPDFYDTSISTLNTAIETIKEEYSKNIFPVMKVKWSEYPN